MEPNAKYGLLRFYILKKYYLKKVANFFNKCYHITLQVPSVCWASVATLQKFENSPCYFCWQGRSKNTALFQWHDVYINVQE
jgi:hypothetical protein